MGHVSRGTRPTVSPRGCSPSLGCDGPPIGCDVGTPPTGTLPSSDVVLEAASSLASVQYPRDFPASVYHRPRAPDDLGVRGPPLSLFPYRVRGPSTHRLAEAEGIITLAAMERQPRHPDPDVPISPDVMVGVVTARQARCEEEDRAVSRWLRIRPPNPAADSPPSSANPRRRTARDGNDRRIRRKRRHAVSVRVDPRRVTPRRRRVWRRALADRAQSRARARVRRGVFARHLPQSRRAATVPRARFRGGAATENFYTILRSARRTRRARYDALLLARGGESRRSETRAAGRVSPSRSSRACW